MGWRVHDAVALACHPIREGHAMIRFKLIRAVIDACPWIPPLLFFAFIMALRLYGDLTR
jgi:hypothetical protein